MYKDGQQDGVLNSDTVEDAIAIDAIATDFAHNRLQ